ncbi:hypothetical protein KR100_14485 [Synechococcus sp. KORDI-100]|nr:hypothetical protein KR100_14485 [Synechococcus sp. KORDI-100]
MGPEILRPRRLVQRQLSQLFWMFSPQPMWLFRSRETMQQKTP